MYHFPIETVYFIHIRKKTKQNKNGEIRTVHFSCVTCTLWTHSSIFVVQVCISGSQSVCSYFFNSNVNYFHTTWLTQFFWQDVTLTVLVSLLCWFKIIFIYEETGSKLNREERVFSYEFCKESNDTINSFELLE